jgi:hypothetical protein
MDTPEDAARAEAVTEAAEAIRRDRAQIKELHASLEKLWVKVTLLEGLSSEPEVGLTVGDAHARLDRQQEWLQTLEGLTRGNISDVEHKLTTDRERDTAIAQAFFSLGQLAADVQIIKAQMEKYGREVHPDLTSKNDITARIINATVFNVLNDVMEGLETHELTRAKVDQFVRLLEANQLQLVLKVD